MTADWKRCGQIIGLGLCVLFGSTANAQLLPPDMLDDELEVELEVEPEVVYRFSVEVIVFEYTSNVAQEDEIFQLKQTPVLPDEIPVFADPTSPTDISAVDAPLIIADDTVEISNADIEIEEIPTLADIEFKLLQADEMTMGEIHERLMELDSYQPVLWTGWTQITKEQGDLRPIQLRRLGPSPIYLNGSFTLYLKNYLHLAVDLTRELQTPVVEDIHFRQELAYGGFRGSNTRNFELADTRTVLFHIKEDRIFRNGQLRYYDHPKFGVLARVNRVEVELPDDEDDSDPAEPAMLSDNNPD